MTNQTTNFEPETVVWHYRFAHETGDSDRAANRLARRRLPTEGFAS
jgi:hypothetical protein